MSLLFQLLSPSLHKNKDFHPFSKNAQRRLYYIGLFAFKKCTQHSKKSPNGVKLPNLITLPTIQNLTFLQDDVHLVDCFAIPRDHLDELIAEGFMVDLDKCIRPEVASFKLNTRMRNTFLKSDLLYPECLAEKDWDSKDVQGKMLEWKNSIMNNEDLHWFHDSSPEPLDTIKPKIQISFDQLIGRKGFEKLKVIISSFISSSYAVVFI